jgi:hypothetical protein
MGGEKEHYFIDTFSPLIHGGIHFELHEKLNHLTVP